MRIALVANGSRGDAQPLMVLGDELSRRGHEIILGVSPDLVEWGERAGLTSLPVGPDARQFFESPDGRRWLGTGDARALTQALGKAMHENAELLDQDTLRVCEDADLIVAGSLGEHRAACIAEARRIPPICLHYAPVRPTRAYPNMFLTTQRLPGRRNLATHSMFQRMYWRSMAPDINQFRDRLGLAPARTPTAARLAAAGALELQAYHPALVPELTDYSANRPLVGFLGPDDDVAERLGELLVDPELDAWLTQGDPPVFVGFGSMPVIEPAAMLHMIMTAAERIGTRVLVGAGWSRYDAPPGTQDRLRIVNGVLNYAAVLPRCRVALHHGGSGTVAAGIAAGIPTFVCSVVADNPFWGARVEQLGVGVHERFADLGAANLESGLRRALEAHVVARSRDVGAVLRADTGAARRAADLVEGRLPGR